MLRPKQRKAVEFQVDHGQNIVGTAAFGCYCGSVGEGSPIIITMPRNSTVMISIKSHACTRQQHAQTTR